MKNSIVSIRWKTGKSEDIRRCGDSLSNGNGDRLLKRACQVGKITLPDKPFSYYRIDTKKLFADNSTCFFLQACFRFFHRGNNCFSVSAVFDKIHRGFDLWKHGRGFKLAFLNIGAGLF